MYNLIRYGALRLTGHLIQITKLIEGPIEEVAEGVSNVAISN